MLKQSIFSILVVGIFIIHSNALPARKRMIYYQQPAAAQLYSVPQRMMYVQYLQPTNAHSRSTQATSALVAGETIATETYLKDCNHAETDVVSSDSSTQLNENGLSTIGAHSAHSIAEAYPDDTNTASVLPSRALTTEVQTEHNADPVTADVPPVAVDITVDQNQPGQLAAPNDIEAKVPRNFNYEGNMPVEPAVPVTVEKTEDLPAPAPIAPLASAISPLASRYLPSKKKVFVELDQSAEHTEVEQPNTENNVAIAEDEENADEETDVAAFAPAAPKKPVHVPNARRPVVKKPANSAKSNTGCSSCAKAASSSKPQLPAGTFFPIDFGGTAGGAIAIANSFSTGEGGSATSHAIAYGSPDAVRARVRPSKLH